MGESLNPKDARITVAITGASGSIYAERLIEVLLGMDVARIYVICTTAAEQVIRYELKKKDGFSLVGTLAGDLSPEHKKTIRLMKNDDFFAPIASGSSAATAMVIVPCSMGTLSRVAYGMSTNLLERAADVMLKERRPLIVCPRETPLSRIHLENMLRLTELGATMVPPMPAFYNHPKNLQDTIDFAVGKLLDSLRLPHSLYPRWNPRLV